MIYVDGVALLVFLTPNRVKSLVLILLHWKKYFLWIFKLYWYYNISVSIFELSIGYNI